MTIRIVCPGCRAAYTVAEELRGKKARCRECQTLFQIGSPTPLSPAIEIVDEMPPLPAAAPPVVELVEEAPRPVPSRRPAAYDEPPRRPRRKPKQSSAAGIIIIILFLGLFLTGSLVLGGFLLIRFGLGDGGDTPQAKMLAPPGAPIGLPGGEPEPPEDFQPDPFPEVAVHGTEPILDPPLDDPARDAPHTDPPPGNGSQLALEVLDKVKRATVFLKMTTANGQVGYGTGFFSLEPGIVVTNAHVVGMLSPGTGKPRGLDVVLNSGEKDEKTIPGEVLEVDRTNDLAVVRVKLPKQPEMLKIKSANSLRETQAVYVFGYPLGNSLGKSVTISQSSVSSLRKEHGVLVRIQVHGGMQPGNSGGPVVDLWGDVVGVSVAMVSNTQINFAVPSDYVRFLGNGRLTDLSLGQPYQAADGIKVPVTLQVLDPLRRLDKVRLDFWTGKPGKSRPATLQAPEAQAGDSERHSAVLAYNRKGTAQGEVTLPALPKGEAYWLQPCYVNRDGSTKWALATVYQPPALVERKGARLERRYQAGAEQRLALSRTSTFQMMVPGATSQPAKFRLELQFTDTVQSVEPDGQVSLRRQFTRMRMEDLAADSRYIYQQLNPYIKSLTADVRLDRERNLVQKKVQAEAQQVPLYIAEGLQNLNNQLQAQLQTMWVTLPGTMVQPGTSLGESEHTLTFDSLPGDAPQTVTFKLQYTYTGLWERDGRTQAVITCGSGPENRDAQGKSQVQGRLVLDVAAGLVSEAELTVRHGFSYVYLARPYPVHATHEIRLKPVAAAKGEPKK